MRQFGTNLSLLSSLHSSIFQQTTYLHPRPTKQSFFTIRPSPFTILPCPSNSPVTSPLSPTSIMAKRPCPTACWNTPKQSPSGKLRNSTSIQWTSSEKRESPLNRTRSPSPLIQRTVKPTSSIFSTLLATWTSPTRSPAHSPLARAPSSSLMPHRASKLKPWPT